MVGAPHPRPARTPLDRRRRRHRHRQRLDRRRAAAAVRRTTGDRRAQCPTAPADRRDPARPPAVRGGDPGGCPGGALPRRVPARSGPRRPGRGDGGPAGRARAPGLPGVRAADGSLHALAAEPRFGGRLHVLPAVPSDELLAWVASADVSAMPNQPRTLNERYSTPNKLFESLAVGTPVVEQRFPGAPPDRDRRPGRSSRRGLRPDASGSRGRRPRRDPVARPGGDGRPAAPLPASPLTSGTAGSERARSSSGSIPGWRPDERCARACSSSRGRTRRSTRPVAAASSMTMSVALQAAGADPIVASFETIQVRGDDDARKARAARAEVAWSAALADPAALQCRPAARRAGGSGRPPTGDPDVGSPRRIRGPRDGGPPRRPAAVRSVERSPRGVPRPAAPSM